MKKSLIIVPVVALLIGAFGLVWWFLKAEVEQPVVTDFEECVDLLNPVMESYPRQCRSGNETFTEDIGNQLDKLDSVLLESPLPNQTVTSPLVVKGQARGNWFF